METAITVKIIKCKYPLAFWYANNIGANIEVCQHESRSEWWTCNHKRNLHILKCDCEIISGEVDATAFKYIPDTRHALSPDDIAYKYTPISDTKNGNIPPRMKSMIDDINMSIHFKAVEFAEWIRTQGDKIILLPDMKWCYMGDSVPISTDQLYNIFLFLNLNSKI